VRNRLEALRPGDQEYIESSLRKDFADSLDIDEAFRKGHEHENRWDYLLGYSPSAALVALEPHKGETHEVRIIINKKKAAEDQLKDHLKAKARIRTWLWVTTGRRDFADTEKMLRLLDQHGITFVGPRVLAQHLPRPLANH